MGHVIVDADGEGMGGRRSGRSAGGVDRQMGRQVVEHRLGHRRRELLGGQPVAPAEHHGRSDARPGEAPLLRQGREHVLGEGFGQRAGLLAAIEHRQGAHIGRQRLGQSGGRKGPKQTDLQEPHPLTSDPQRRHRVFEHAAGRPHRHHHPLGRWIAHVLHQVVMAAAEGGEAIHRLGHVGRHGVVEEVHRFAGLEGHIGVLGGAAQHRMVGAEAAAAVGGDGRHRHQLVEQGVGDFGDFLDFVAGAEAIEAVQHRQPAEQGGPAGDGGKIARLLHARRHQNGATGTTGGHQIALIAEDREGLGGDGTASHMQHHRREFTGPAVEVGQHQQQPLGGGEAGGKRTGLQGAMEGPGGTSLALHLHHAGHGAPEIGPDLSRPGIRRFTHRRGGRDRVEGDHLTEAIGHPRHRLVAIDGEEGGGEGSSGGHSEPSSSTKLRARPTCTSTRSPTCASLRQASDTVCRTPPKSTSA